MSWKSGGELAEQIEAAIMPHADTIGAKSLAKLGKTIATAFRDMDCDVLYYCEGFIGDADNLLDHPDAPKKPTKGDAYDRDGERYVFDGKRWQYSDDE